MESSRVEDINGWYEIKGNPLSKVGVYPYLGSSVDSDGRLGLERDKIYNVYRPEEELSSDECIDSFKLIPWIDDHEMLGDDPGTTPAERKGVEGVIGEDVYFDKSDGSLKGNIKVFSENLKNIIEEGKDELSCGYRCSYEVKAGVFDGEYYDIIQRNMRGNHLATVDEGRMGPEVSVLDEKSLFSFTIDSKDFVMTEKEDVDVTEDEKPEITTIDDILSVVKELMKPISDLMNIAGVKDMEEKESQDEEEEEDAGGNGPSKVASSKELIDNADSMDSLIKENKLIKSSIEEIKKTAAIDAVKSLSKKNILAERVSCFTGTFDHSEMTLDEVAKYGVTKLSIPCEDGHEKYVIEGYLHNRDASTAAHSVSLDSKEFESSSSVVEKYLRGEK